MEFPTKFDRVKSRWSIVYIEGTHAIISKKCYITFSEDRFVISKHCRLFVIVLDLGVSGP